ncbi:MAG: hypothetical protein NTX25_05400 [Proteobacteria bacterium]|nr:hypothetical protein [Pseudomonadota bacterium]
MNFFYIGMILSTFGLSSLALSDESMTVTGSRIHPESTAGIAFSHGDDFPKQRKLCSPDDPGSCQGGGSSSVAKTITNEEGERCVARFSKINKPTPLCGSFGELPTWMRGDFNQIYLICKDRPEYLWKETLTGCSDAT